MRGDSLRFDSDFPTSKTYAVDRTGGKVQLDTDEVLHRVLCLPDHAPELQDDADIVRQVSAFIKDCSQEHAHERQPRVLMDPVERWLQDLEELDIAKCTQQQFNLKFAPQNAEQMLRSR